MRPRLDASAPIAPFLAATPHAFTRRELLRTWSRHQLDLAIADGTVTRLLPGVYCGTAHTRTPVVMGEALNLWQPAGAVTGSLALHLYAPDLTAPVVADYVVPHGHRLDTPAWVRLRQTGPVQSRIRAQGVNCLDMPRALLDAWRFTAPSVRQDLFYEALWSRVCTWRQLARELDSTARVAGRPQLQRLLTSFAAGATSPLEARAMTETFADARFRDLEWQVALRLGSRRIVVDILHRASMVVVELDGDRFHSTRQARDADRERQTDLAAAGYSVLRLGWRDIASRPAWCRDRLLAAISGAGHLL